MRKREQEAALTTWAKEALVRVLGVFVFPKESVEGKYRIVLEHAEQWALSVAAKAKRLKVRKRDFMSWSKREGVKVWYRAVGKKGPDWGDVLDLLTDGYRRMAEPGED